MKRARFIEDQIIGVLKEHEAGAKTADLARKHGVSEASSCAAQAVLSGRARLSQAPRPMGAPQSEISTVAQSLSALDCPPKRQCDRGFRKQETASALLSDSLR
jgi:hypothetical protein